MLSVTNDCLLSWLRCAELLQVWCNEVLKTSSRCAELLIGTDSAPVTAHIKTVNQSLCELAGREISQFKSLISAELSHIMKDEKQSENELGMCSDVKVITHCVRSFVDAQLHFFQSAAGQLAQFSSCHDNISGVGMQEFDVFTGSSPYVSHQVASAGDEGLSVIPSSFLSLPPGLSVSPQRTSPQITAEKSQRSAGRCATDKDLNAVIKMLSCPSNNSKVSPMMTSLPEHSQANWAHAPVYTSNHGYQQQLNLSAKTNVNGVYNSQSYLTSSPLSNQFAISRQDNSDLKTSSWSHSGQLPPTVYVEESWPALGTELWSQYGGWSPGKVCDSTVNNVATAIDSCSSDDSSNCDTTQQNLTSTHSQLRRRHSSSEQCSALNTQLTPLNVPSNGSESKPAWGLMVPQPGAKDKSGLTIEGHRPLFMQRSDPLAQRSFSCWQTGGGVGQSTDNCSLFGAAGSNSALSQHRMTSDKTF